MHMTDKKVCNMKKVLRLNVQNLLWLLKNTILQIGEYLQTTLQYTVHVCNRGSVISHWDACILSAFHAIEEIRFHW